MYKCMPDPWPRIETASAIWVGLTSSRSPLCSRLSPGNRGGHRLRKRSTFCAHSTNRRRGHRNLWFFPDGPTRRVPFPSTREAAERPAPAAVIAGATKRPQVTVHRWTAIEYHCLPSPDGLTGRRIADRRMKCARRTPRTSDTKYDGNTTCVGAGGGRRLSVRVRLTDNVVSPPTGRCRGKEFCLSVIRQARKLFWPQLPIVKAISRLSSFFLSFWPSAKQVSRNTCWVIYICRWSRSTGQIQRLSCDSHTHFMPGNYRLLLPKGKWLHADEYVYIVKYLDSCYRHSSTDNSLWVRLNYFAHDS